MAGARAQSLVGKGGEEVQGVPVRLAPKSARGSRLTFRVPAEFTMGASWGQAGLDPSAGRDSLGVGSLGASSLKVIWPRQEMASI